MHDDSLRKILLSKDLDLEKCIRICKANEANDERYKAISGEKAETVNKMSYQKSAKPKSLYHKQKYTEKSSTNGEEKECRFCSFKHIMKKKSCPAFGKQCKKCGADNHMAEKCHSNKKVRPLYVNDQDTVILNTLRMIRPTSL